MSATNQLNDAILIESYINGDEYSLTKLIEKHQARIYSFIYSKVNDDFVADDIFQDTFIKVINKLKTSGYVHNGKFLSWVMRIAHNLGIDYYRNNKKNKFNRESDEFSIFDFIQDHDSNFEKKLIDDQVSIDLSVLVEQLPKDQKEVLNMRIFQDLSFKDIAELTGVSINTALGRMRYALENLRKIIEKNNVYLA